MRGTPGLVSARPCEGANGETAAFSMDDKNVPRGAGRSPAESGAEGELEMSTQENKALIRRWLEAIDTGEVGVVDDFLGSDYVDHNPPPFPGLSPGIEGARQGFTYALNAFSEFRHEIEDQYADGDRVITRLTGYGKHTGEFLGIPATGKEVKMEGIAVHRIVDGRMVEHWAQVDALGLLQQLGAIPGPGEAP